jgi:hypothetical protein
VRLTSSSIPSPSPRTSPGRSCTSVRCQAQEDRPGSDLLTSNKWITKLHRVPDVSESIQFIVHDKNDKRTLRDSECRGPLVTQDVETDGTIGVNVRVVDLGRERDLRRFEGIVGRKDD